MYRFSATRSSVVLACTVTLGAIAALGQAVKAPIEGASVADCPPIVELTKALAWPLVAGAMALFLREPLRGFVTALGTRITKLSVFKVELELVPAATAATGPLLDDLRSATTSAAISDSSRAMLEQLQTQTPADFAEINLGTGKEWLSSRLYIAAVMLQRMRGIQVLVFVESTPRSTRSIVAVVPVQEIRWALARRYPWLETAFWRAYVLFGSQTMPDGTARLPDPKSVHLTTPMVVSNTGAVDPAAARFLAASFIDSLQEQTDWSGYLPETPPSAPAPGVSGPAVAAPPASRDKRTWAERDKGSWTDLDATTRERAAWVTRDLLSELVSPDAFLYWTQIAVDAPRVQRTRSVLRRAAPYIALVDQDRGFIRLINRRVLLEEVAASLGEEPGSTS